MLFEMEYYFECFTIIADRASDLNNYHINNKSIIAQFQKLSYRQYMLYLSMMFDTKEYYKESVTLLHLFNAITKQVIHEDEMEFNLFKKSVLEKERKWCAEFSKIDDNANALGYYIEQAREEVSRKESIVSKLLKFRHTAIAHNDTVRTSAPEYKDTKSLISLANDILVPIICLFTSHCYELSNRFDQMHFQVNRESHKILSALETMNTYYERN